jgi:Mg-chelatase subunit ChlI
LELGAEGHRSDISIFKTSKTIAAFNGHLTVNDSDLEEAISLVLGEDKSISQRIQKIKRDIEIREENKDNSKENKLNNETQLDCKLENESKTKEEDLTDKNIKNLNLENNTSNEFDLDSEINSKTKSDSDLKVNEDKIIENFNEGEIQDWKTDIKKY